MIVTSGPCLASLKPRESGRLSWELLRGHSRHSRHRFQSILLFLFLPLFFFVVPEPQIEKQIETRTWSLNWREGREMESEEKEMVQK
jgi:hypothetical protein